MKKKDYIKPDFVLIQMDEEVTVLASSEVSKTGDFGDDNHTFTIFEDDEDINANKYNDKIIEYGWGDF